MESELLRPFDDDVFACGIPTNHVMIFGPLKQGVQLCQERRLRL